MIILEFLNELEFTMDFPDDDGFDKKLRGFWCDGIDFPYNTGEARKIINDNGFIELPMYFGRDGQDRYKLILHFGEEARLINLDGQYRYMRECVPDFSNEPDSILIDEENQIVEVYLK